MEFSEARFPGTAPVDAYGNGGFRFADMSHKGSILCLPDEIVAWPATGVSDMDEAGFSKVFSAQTVPELVLIGTGVSVAAIPDRIRELFRKQSVRLEVMGTGAAARTYNILLAEGRTVGAALIAVD